jgi:ribosomal protein S4
LISQGAVSIDGEKITSKIAIVKNGSIIKVGKRRIVRLVDADQK